MENMEDIYEKLEKIVSMQRKNKKQNKTKWKGQSEKHWIDR